MPDNLLIESTGLTSSDLSLATALPSDVISGKTFYSGDKNLKTGSVKNVRDLTAIRLDSENDIPLFYGIDGGFHQNTDGGFRYCIWSNLGGQRAFVDGTNTWICFSIDDYKLPSNIGWQYTINPGGSVIIPRGYHDGEHRVYANNVQSQLKSASFNLSLNSGGVAYGEVKESWWSPGGTVIGMTRCQIRTDTESGESSSNWTRCTVENGQVHFVNSFTHRGGQAYASGDVVFI